MLFKNADLDPTHCVIIFDVFGRNRRSNFSWVQHFDRQANLKSKALPGLSPEDFAKDSNYQSVYVDLSEQNRHSEIY